ncbi:MAG: 50S ribosomal protein L21 [Bacteroidales bacterium]|nr:50S ribosomal protein L21 [Bacteroidales bacterium]
MYAIVEIAGQQFKVEKEQEIFVHRLEGEAGSTIEFDNVLFFDNDGKIDIGNPMVDGVLVKARIVEHMKGDKVIVFHKKRRKGYQKENGHRQFLSKLVIEDIVTGAKKAAKKEEPKAEAKKEAPKAEPKKETPKAEAKKEEPKAEVKKEEPKAETKKETKAAEPKAEKETKQEEPKAEAKKETATAKASEENETQKAEKTEEKAEDKKADKKSEDSEEKK